METDPLQQLRDIQLPPEPSWWPPAWGWWVVALGCLLLLIWLLRHGLAYWRQRAPIRAARKLYAHLYQQFKSQEIDAQTYCHQCNELLKRLLVHGLGQRELGPQVDEKWLSRLDEISDSRDFSEGPGRVLGTERFRRTPQIDVHGLDSAMTKLLKAVQP